MIERIALVSCVKSKRSAPAPARDLYVSTLFRLQRAYAEREADRWFVLSAEHGLLHPDQVVAPYERTLNRMSKSDRLQWAARVRTQLEREIPARSRVIILAGERYREHLVGYLRDGGCEVSIPLEGLTFGRQLQHLGALGGR